MQFGNIFDAADEIGSINQDYAFLEELASFNACMQVADPTRNIWSPNKKKFTGKKYKNKQDLIWLRACLMLYAIVSFLIK